MMLHAITRYETSKSESKSSRACSRPRRDSSIDYTACVRSLAAQPTSCAGPDLFGGPVGEALRRPVSNIVAMLFLLGEVLRGL